MDILGFDWSLVWPPGCITMRFSDVSYDIKKNFLCWKFNHSWQFRNSSLAFEFPSSAWWTHFNVMGNWIWYSYWLNFIKLNFRSCSSLGICHPPPLKKKPSPFFGSNCRAIFWNEWKINFSDEKDAQCSEMDFWVHEYFCTIFTKHALSISCPKSVISCKASHFLM